MTPRIQLTGAVYILDESFLCTRLRSTVYPALCALRNQLVVATAACFSEGLCSFGSPGWVIQVLEEDTIVLLICILANCGIGVNVPEAAAVSVFAVQHSNVRYKGEVCVLKLRISNKTSAQMFTRLPI